MRLPRSALGLNARLLALAGAIELPLIIALYVTSIDHSHSALLVVMEYYHLIPLGLLSFAWLLLFGHGAPTLGDLTLWHVLFFVGTYAGQVVLTALLLRLALGLTRRSSGPLRGR